MKKLLLLPVILSTVFISSFGQINPVAQEFANTITETDLNRHLSVLASDALQGRETGKAGQKMAAAYIAEQFKLLGLAGPVTGGGNLGYYQTVPLYTSKPGEIYISTKKGKHHNFEDIIYYGSAETQGEVNKEIIFGGSGSEADFELLDIKNKAVLILSENKNGWRASARVAIEKGASMLFVVNTTSDDNFKEMVKTYNGSLNEGRLSLEKSVPESTGGVFFVSPTFAEELFNTNIKSLKADSKKIQSVTISYNISLQVDEIYSENVLGYLEGTDLKDELVVITAHYDHLGIGDDEVFNGADDDGSGTVSVLELAQAFVDAKNAGKGPRRSILFMTVTGEEKGLLGSEYYAANPIFPLENTVVDLNIDMVGRVDPAHEDNPDYVYLVGADRLSSELHDISEKTNKTYTNLTLDYTYNDETHPDRIYYRSDHWNFAKNNVPIIFYFNGVHADYHQSTDTIEKIDFNILKTRAQLVFHTAWVLANKNQRLVLNNTALQKGN
jgi:hypothetical protein